ncbi:MAG: CoA transferase subunit A [Lachnospiraceae bacterium]|nr:CoA transferase subunit A [Lachnospiraceae bacterium]
MGKTQIVSAQEAAKVIKDGMTVMVGGFMNNGSPRDLIKAICDAGAKDLTIVCNDCGFVGVGAGALLANGQVKKLIASHVGLNKQVAEKYNAGELELVLQPQGTLAEQIRAAGAGLGGVITPTGMGTIVAEGKDTIVIDGKEYLVEKPIHADVAVIGAYMADETGNAIYKGSTRNFNVLMASAADTVIVAAEHIVPAGEIGPDHVETPHIFVDYLVQETNIGEFE